ADQGHDADLVDEAAHVGGVAPGVTAVVQHAQAHGPAGHAAVVVHVGGPDLQGHLHALLLVPDDPAGGPHRPDLDRGPAGRAGAARAAPAGAARPPGAARPGGAPAPDRAAVGGPDDRAVAEGAA